ncbi:phosphoglycerate dehydrogenase [Telmatospirillum sp.]|uniref:phosphoglycerate dehydrogenase n=1 Tax=Telmatospirillum sp. TaxID=2079197 RepID=UPI0028427252|nr:phosphoglycerate dehydrogenase [Telmatospirillum sp.]MDR3438797.1 phosphoglycerate dehydrogenase [Telmatospirillum sp.]
MAAGKKVLVTTTNYSKLCKDAKAQMESNGWTIIENDFGRPMTLDEILERVGDVDAVMAGADYWTEQVFQAAPKLKIIARFGVGVDNIDIEAARRRGIKVVNAVGRNANAVAELTIGLILSAMRNIPALHQSVRQGGWDRFVGDELMGRTVGLLGLGNIGQRVARKLAGFDVRILAYDKFPNRAAAEKLNVTLVPSEQLLADSDVVCLLLPSLKETYHFMNRETFARMKDGAYFVNTARGALVDEAALGDALTSGKLTAAAIDVYETEPVSADNPLFRIKNIITTPHTASETYETFRNVGAHTAQAILDEFEGINPPKGL